jgi:hypothetical protein
MAEAYGALVTTKSGGRMVPQQEMDFCGRLWRNTFAGQWEETAQLIWPEHRNTFFYGSFNWPGQKKTQQQVDATGMLALHRFCRDRGLAAHAGEQQVARARGQQRLRDEGPRHAALVRHVTKLLFKYRRNPLANFRGQNNANWRSLGASATPPCSSMRSTAGIITASRAALSRRAARRDVLRREPPGRRRSHLPLVPADRAQAAQKWGEGALPTQLQGRAEKGSQWPFNFLHCVKPREDYDPERSTCAGCRSRRYYVSIEGSA